MVVSNHTAIAEFICDWLYPMQIWLYCPFMSVSREAETVRRVSLLSISYQIVYDLRAGLFFSPVPIFFRALRDANCGAKQRVG